MSGTESIADWIAAKPKRGRYTFSREEVAADRQDELMVGV